MATQVQIRRGTAAENDAFTGAAGELTYDTTNKRVRIHDGGTAGGFELKTENSSGDTLFADNEKAIFGAGSDLQIYHDGTHSLVQDNGSGNLYLDTSNGTQVVISADNRNKIMAVFNEDGDANLRYAGSTKLATTSTGIDVTGTVTADGLTVDGSGTDVVLIKNDSSASTDFLTWSAASDNRIAIRSHTNPDYQAGAWGGLHFQSGTGYSGSLATIGVSQRYGDATERQYSGGLRIAQKAGALADNWKTNLDITPNGDISFYEDTGTTPKFFWDASAESLGIGTSSPATPIHINSSENTLLHLESTDANVYLKFTDSNSVNAGYIGYVTDDMEFWTNNAERMRIDSSGNVGIGTSSTTRRLDVAASLSDCNIEFRTNKADGLVQLLMTNDARQWNVRVNSDDTFAIRDNTANAERMRIDNSGSLLVNTTVGYGKFTVQNNAGTGKVLLDNYASVPTSENVLSIYADATRGYLQCYNSGWKDIVICGSGGSVGIGTTSPSTYGKLAVTASSGVIGNFESTQSGTNANLLNLNATQTNSSSGIRLQVNSGTTAQGRIQLNGDNAILFQNTSSDTERMRIDSSGHLLVGTTSTAGSVSNDKIISGGIFRTARGSIAPGVGSGALTTMFTLPSPSYGTWMVNAQLQAASNAYSETAIVHAQNTNFATTTIVNAGLLNISNSGSAIQVQQNSGAITGTNIIWSVIRLH
jgi:hypothetical protein